MFVPRKTCLLSTNRTAKQQVQPIPGLPISALLGHHKEWVSTLPGEGNRRSCWKQRSLFLFLALSLLQNLRSSPSLPPSLSRPPPAFVCPQPIASSVKNGSVMHLEGDETFIAGLFLFFFFSLRHGESPHQYFNGTACPPCVSVGVFCSVF